LQMSAPLSGISHNLVNGMLGLPVLYSAVNRLPLLHRGVKLSCEFIAAALE
jgi:hypothetical protein